MNSGVLAFGAGGRVNTLAVADFASPFFNGGTPTGSLGSLVVATATPTAFVAGLGYDAAGALCYAPAGVIDTRVVGLAVDAGGRLLTSTANAIAGYIAGVPVDAAGRVCINAPSPPFDMKAFSNAFASAEFT